MGKPGVYWDASWNPVTGCTPCSPACDNCWARATAGRFPRAHGTRTCPACHGRGYRGYVYAGGDMDFCDRCGGDYPGTGREAIPFSEIIMHPERLEQPLHWRKPRVVAVCWMGDLFHEDVPTEFIAKVWITMLRAEQHQFLLLTKRPERMRREVRAITYLKLGLPNVWLGVSVWDQHSADRHIPVLLETPAAHRWVSVEPCLSRVDLSDWLGPDPTFDHESGLHQVVLGCESGPKRRPMPHDCARSLRDQCAEVGMLFYLKQMAEKEDGTGRVIHAPRLDGRQHLDELAWR